MGSEPPIQFAGRGILLDIEGTTSSISFVYDVMFPFVRRELNSYLLANWGSPELNRVVDSLVSEADGASLNSADLARDEVLRLMDQDVKSTGLKHLQGLIWEAGFASGELRAHVYDDVLPALQAWIEAGRDVRIYSSGSIQAQKLFFGHTIAGDLLPLLKGHYDTTTGPKKEPASYRAIAALYGLPASEVLFLSDIVAELDAARSAGMRAALVVRPGNAEGQSSVAAPHATINSFEQVSLG